MFSLFLNYPEFRQFKSAPRADVQEKAAQHTTNTGSHTARALRMGAFGLMLSFSAGCAHKAPATQDATAEQRAQQVALAAQIDAALARANNQPRWSTSLDDTASFASFNTDAVSVSYQGSAADLLKAIAASRGVSFKVTGPSPHIPIFVFVEANGETFNAFMSDLDKQLGQRAVIVLKNTGYELRYRQ